MEKLFISVRNNVATTYVYRSGWHIIKIKEEEYLRVDTPEKISVYIDGLRNAMHGNDLSLFKITMLWSDYANCAVQIASRLCENYKLDLSLRSVADAAGGVFAKALFDLKKTSIIVSLPDGLYSVNNYAKKELTVKSFNGSAASADITLTIDRLLEPAKPASVAVPEVQPAADTSERRFFDRWYKSASDLRVAELYDLMGIDSSLRCHRELISRFTRALILSRLTDAERAQVHTESDIGRFDMKINEPLFHNILKELSQRIGEVRKICPQTDIRYHILCRMIVLDSLMDSGTTDSIKNTIKRVRLDVIWADWEKQNGGNQ